MVNGRMEGLLARDYADRFPEARAALTGWIRLGQLKSKEDVEVGLERRRWPGVLVHGRELWQAAVEDCGPSSPDFELRIRKRRARLLRTGWPSIHRDWRSAKTNPSRFDDLSLGGRL